MKKAMFAALAVVCAVFVGCKTVPTTEDIYSTSYAVGVSAGLVCNMTKIDDTSRNAVIDIMNEVQQCVPATNQTFEAAWTPIAKSHVAQLIADGKIDKGQGDLILALFGLAVKGIDYIFEVRYPQAKQYRDLTVAAVDGFIGGFLTVFKPANVTDARGTVLYDAEAYEYLKQNLR